jgi:serine O-acetyltransferase
MTTCDETAVALEPTGAAVAEAMVAEAAVSPGPVAAGPTDSPGAAAEPRLPLRKLLAEDIATVLAKDPAASSRAEVLLYPHIHALWTYRIAHRLWRRGHRFVPRALSLLARAVSGIEIHPGARIGRRFFVDHGTAVVIGETVRIGDDVMLYHQVTLGSVGWWKDLRRPAGSRRHPVVGDRVIIGTGASVLGPVTVGSDSRVGAHAIVLDDLPPHSRVVAPTCEVLPALDTGAPEPTAHEPAAPALDQLAS